MIYAYDKSVGIPMIDLYDTQSALAAIGAAKDMYEKGLQEIKDFRKDYGTFDSPFAKDMARYNQMVDSVKNTINDLYSRGIDPLRSAEGRNIVSRAILNFNTSEYNAMRSNAKLGYAYLNAMQNLRQKGKYSEAQEMFDIMNSNGTAFLDFSTANGNGTYNMWDRTSPIEAVTLQDLTRGFYQNRTPRDLSPADFSDERLKNYKYDPRYQYSGYLYSDLMKAAPGASASLVGDPRAAFFRDLAAKKVAASGRAVTDEAVEQQFLNDIAEANTWALVDPIKKVDEYSKMDYQFRQNQILEGIKHRNAMEEIAAKKGNDGEYSGSYASLVSKSASSKLNAHRSIMVKEFEKAYDDAMAIKDPAERQQRIADLDGLVWANYLSKPIGPDDSIGGRLLNLKPGQKGVHTLNDILALRSIKGDTKFDGSEMLERSGFSVGSDGWFELNAGAKVVSPHQIMRNILTYETGNGFSLKTLTGANVSREGLIHKIGEVADEDASWVQATTNERLKRTEQVKPDTRENGYIIAPDENGVNRLYMKVKIKQGAQLGSIGSWMPQGEHHGFWVETGITLTPMGDIDLESKPIIYGQETSERKQYTNAAVTQSYTDTGF